TPRVSEAVTKRLPQYVLKTGDVVLGRKGGVERSALIRPPQEGWFLGSDGISIRPSRDCHDEYLGLQFRSARVQGWLLQHAIGTTMPSLNQTILRNVVIPLPPAKAEQEAIAGALGDADALIESLEQLLAKKRLPGFSGKWEMKRLRELANIQRGASPRPIDSPIWFDDKSTVGWVRISDVTKSGMYLLDTTQRLSPLGIQHSRPVSRGSLIMSICATVGRPVITKIDTCIHDGFVVFDSLRTTQHFMYYVLQSIEDDWSRHGQTGSQMNLNTTLINSTKVSVPPTNEEQAAIADTLTDMDAEIADLEAQLAKTRALKQGMMQKLLTGEIRLL
ncbi:MAG TPA: restriction endonuclease subunit S, partial [Rhodocyclaceae bacterium]|nr:restriction endonuclease subunit S [Rhodocyclaceae bacterium]